MPAYTYRCHSCNAEFERTQMFSEKALRRCPECHRSTARRIPQLPSIIFRGHGWYSIDHRTTSGQKSRIPVEKNDKAGITNDQRND